MIGRSLEFVRCGDNLCFALYDGKNVTTAATGIVGFSASIVATYHGVASFRPSS